MSGESRKWCEIVLEAGHIVSLIEDSRRRSVMSVTRLKAEGRLPHIKVHGVCTVAFLSILELRCCQAKGSSVLFGATTCTISRRLRATQESDRHKREVRDILSRGLFDPIPKLNFELWDYHPGQL